MPREHREAGAVRHAVRGACWAALLGLVTAWGDALAAAADTPRKPGLMLGPGDIVTVSVHGHPDLTTTLDIGGDGRIAVPLAGPVQVGGLSTAAAATKVAAALRQGGFLNNPQVTVALTESRSQQVSVLGEVRSPGRYAIGAQLTLMDALALAGGITPSSGPVAYLLRRGKKGTTRTELDLDKLARGQGDFAILELQPGDTLMVPKAEHFYIYGEVKSPNMYPLKPDTTVMQALSLAGGLTDRGSDKRVEIRRRDQEGRMRQVPADLTDVVKPDDILYVKERFF
jgi:polysaccharide export outer membrane protein